MYGVKAKKIACFKLDTKWVHIVPMTKCFFQSPVRKNTHRHKEYDWLTSREYYGSTSTKKLRIIIIGFDNPTNNNGNKDNDILTITSLASDPPDAGKGGGRGLGNHDCRPPRVLAIKLLPPLPPEMVARMSSASIACLLLPPPTTPPKSVAQVARMLLPSKTDLSGSTPQAIFAAGIPAAQIASQTAHRPFSALLQPAAIAVIIVLAARR